MRTSEIISNAQQFSPNWSRTSLLNFLDMIEQMIMGNVVTDKRIIDPTTGRDPLLITSSGVFQYSIDNTTIATIPAAAYLVEFIYSGYDYRASDCQGYDQWEVPYNFRIPVTTISGTYGVSATIIFDRDPGSGTQFYIRCFRGNNKLTSETIQTQIPERFHYDVLQGVVGLVEMNENGKSERWDTFEKSRLPLIRWHINKNQDNYTYPKYSTPGF